MVTSLRSALFPDDGENTFAIIDGASCGELLSKLDELQPDYACLYSGALEPDIEEVAPYLIELLPEHPFTEWLLDNFHGKHWGIFARSPASLRTMRKHFRTFLLVKSPDSKLLYFRYYDPRVLSIVLPSTLAAEREEIFGEVSTFLGETEEGNIDIFRRRGRDLDRQKCLATDAVKKS